jgi:hypothetical protein
MVIRSRADERGAAMFVVLMVILILSGIGTFALTNARYELQASGFVRNQGVAEEMAQFGALASMNEVSAAPQAYLRRMRQTLPSGSKCRSYKVDTSSWSIAPPCLQLGTNDIELRTGLETERLVRPGQPSSAIPGSLGLTKLGARFWVEMTDPFEVVRPIPGYPIDGSPGTPKFVDLTVTSTGGTFHDLNQNGWLDNSADEAGSFLGVTGRGHLLVGPVFGGY